MKSFISAVSTAFAVLFLAVSLTGCSDGEKLGLQSESNSVFSKNDGKIELSLLPGVRSLKLYFEDAETSATQGELIKRLLEEKGIKVLRSGQHGYRPHQYFLSITVPQEITVYIEAIGLDGIVVKTATNTLAMWDPTQGNRVVYSG